MFLFVMCSAIIITVFPVHGQPCDVNCISPDCTHNYCLECKDGFFPYFGECYQCVIDNCTKCYSLTNCLECKEGFYRLQTIFSNYLCYPCPGNCSKCVSTSSCSECIPGKYGQICSNDCDLCHNGICDKNYCTNGCKEGYYEYDKGDTGLCFPCTDFDTNCLSCTRQDSTTTCDQCKTGYYIQSGRCALCSGTTSCDTCPDGKWGVNCEFVCPYCTGNTCARNSGECTSGCIDGYFQTNSQPCEPCPISCRNNVCVNNSGTCSQGCKGRRTGATCNAICMGNCATCDQYNALSCRTCYNGYYGIFCNDPCGNCVYSGNTLTCDKFGNCTHGCVNGYTGDICQQRIVEDTSSVQHSTATTKDNSVESSASITSSTETITTQDQLKNPSTKDSPPIAAMAGGVTGGIVVIVTIVVVILIIVKRRHDTKPHTYENENVMKDMRSYTNTTTDSRTVEGDREAAYINTVAEYSTIGEAVDDPASGYETLDIHTSVESNYTALA